ncbi:uncharacterized protein LOC142976276 [Anticarsia gemmatalis]|uniref:uncharacterized protein LOC142976276 n=1 Tax=Anticarsia gemmatalis TaxID=129554 RepID=UPI003F772EAF
MPRKQCTPPSTPNTVTREKSISDSDLLQVKDTNAPSYNVTLRDKRQRLDDSPQSNKSTDGVDRLKDELKELLISWKQDQDQRLTTWKAEQDSTLSLLVRDVSALKLQCQQIQKSNSEIEKGMEFINHSYEELQNKIYDLEKERAENLNRITKLEYQLQDMRLVTRSATIELRNVPPKDQEKSSDLVAVLSDIGQAMKLNIEASDLRDIYRLPGKPGITRPIVAEFASVSTRNNFLTTVRGFNKDRPISEKLNTKTIGMPGEKRAIYADEHLTPTLKKLLFDARMVAKAHNYSCWHSNGRIFMRLEKDSKPIHIKTGECLAFLVKQQ